MNESPRVLGNRYEVGDLLGRGGMAEVHLGRDARLGRGVAIKLLRTDLARDPTFQARFRREAQSAAALNHPAVVAVYDTGEEVVTEAGGAVVSLPYIVMEHVEGRTLRDLLEAQRQHAEALTPPGAPVAPGALALDVGLALEVTSGVLSALEYSHRAGIVHRDIKPANVMLTPVGDVKVMDFGIARALADASATMTQTQAVIGTAQYLSPEQARGETVDARSDLYSTGCLLYELLTGRPPFVADSPVAVAYQHVREQPRPPSDFNPAIPESVDRIVMHSLAKDREDRYQDAARFRADVEAARAGREVAAPVSVPAADGHAAATEFMAPAAAGTQAMPQVWPAGSVLPGGPSATGEMFGGGDAYDTGYTRRSQQRQERSGNRGMGYALLAIGVLAVFALVFFLVTNVFRSPSTASVKVPNVVNLTEADAKTQIEGAGFTFASTPAVSDTVPAGQVIKQDPAADSLAEPKTTVTVTVSSGSDQAQVPDVTNMTQEEARKAIEGAGLRVGNVTTEDSTTVAKDRVIRSDPAAGQALPKDSQVNLVLASGNVTVPDVRGKTQLEAQNILGDLGLTYNIVQEPSSKDEGTVIKQDKVDVTVPVGSPITLTVATPLPTTSTSSSTTTTTPPTTPTGTGTPTGSGTTPP